MCLLLVVTAHGAAWAQAPDTPGSLLTPDERAYLDQLGPITLCVDPDWMPFEGISRDGRHIGIAADLMALVAERLDVTFRLIPTQTWAESVQFSREGRCHIMPLVNQSPERDEWLIFTDVYFADPNVFITREEHEFIYDPARLLDEKLVLPQGSSIEGYFRRNFPNITLMIVETDTDALRAVSERRADVTVRSLSLAAYTIRQEGWFNLKIAGKLEEYGNRMRIGVSGQHEPRNPHADDQCNRVCRPASNDPAEQRATAVCGHCSPVGPRPAAGHQRNFGLFQD